jgi:hypothetical protein
MKISEKYAHYRIDCKFPSKTLIDFWIKWYEEKLTELERLNFKKIC